MLTVTQARHLLARAYGAAELRRPADPRPAQRLPVPYYFYLEYRQSFSIFDTFAPADPEVNGVGVRIAPDLGIISQS
jgi:hypothetical protein